MAEIFDQLESQKVAIEGNASGHITRVDHRVIEGQLRSSGIARRVSRCGFRFGSRARNFLCCTLLRFRFFHGSPRRKASQACRPCKYSAVTYRCQRPPCDRGRLLRLPCRFPGGPMRSRFSPFAAALILFSGATWHAAARPGGDEAAVREIVQKYMDARDRQDSHALESLFTRDADQLVSSG